jgi:N-acyl-D-aspartate/D-glutamate deacylase
VRTVRDNATFADAYRYATGIEYVIVNGKVSVDKGKFNGALNGKILQKK